VSGDPSLSVEEAARRRDFTINAMLFDPATGELVDPWGGRADLEARRLRAVDTATFGDDPLRALRALQLAARFELQVDEATARLCASMPLRELPADRVFGEIEKLLLKARRPSLGLVLAREWGMLEAIAPELVPMAATPQDPEWHPEGDVWTHTLQVVDEARALLEGLEDDHPRQLAVMLGALCHDLGKPATTRFEEGRFRSRGHEEAGPAADDRAARPLERLHAAGLRRPRPGARAGRPAPQARTALRRPRAVSPTARSAVSRASASPTCSIRVARADCLGRRPGRFEPVAMEWFLERVKALDVAVRPPEPLLRAATSGARPRAPDRG
jgi:tRNA nucleotidyltransferase (CCA-adding enzyme)